MIVLAESSIDEAFRLLVTPLTLFDQGQRRLHIVTEMVHNILTRGRIFK